jgi:hypothetical protein
MNIGNAPKHRRGAIAFPLFKGKGDKKECKNYRGKVYLTHMENCMEEC